MASEKRANDKKVTADVLIIGAGPTGLSLALNLLRSPKPISVLILDKSPTPALQSRALVVQSRSLELLNQFTVPPARESDSSPPSVVPSAKPSTVVSDLRQTGLEGLGLSVFIHGHRSVSLDMSQAIFAGTQFPLPILVSQADTEAAMIRALHARGVKIQRSSTVTKITSHAEYV